MAIHCWRTHSNFVSNYKSAKEIHEMLKLVYGDTVVTPIDMFLPICCYYNGLNAPRTMCFVIYKRPALVTVHLR